MNQPTKGKSKILDRPQERRPFGDIVGLWRHKSDVARPTCREYPDHGRPVYRGPRPLKVTDVHRVVDIVSNSTEDFEDPLWLVRRGPLAVEDQSDKPPGSPRNEQPPYVCSQRAVQERKRTMSFDTKDMPPARTTESAKVWFPQSGHHSTDHALGRKNRSLPTAPLRIRRNPNRLQSEVTRPCADCHIRAEGAPYAQSSERRSNKLPLDDAISPLQRMTDRLNEWSMSVLPNDGARLRPGPAVRLPVVRQAAGSTGHSSEKPTSSCPPFPSISHSKFDLRFASEKPGLARTRLYSSPFPFESGRSRMLPICQESSRSALKK